MKSMPVLACWGLLLVGLSSCSLAPKYSVPATAPSPAFKETLSAAEAGTWQTAVPAEEAARGEWWKVFNDSQLDDLEGQALAANQNLAAAAARVQEARAIEGVTGAARFPSLSAGFGPSRQQNSPGSLGVPPGSARPDAQTVWRAQANISYEVDLFGRVQRSVEGALATAEQSAADLANAQLVLTAELAANYVNLRALDTERDRWLLDLHWGCGWDVLIRAELAQGNLDAAGRASPHADQLPQRAAAARCARSAWLLARRDLAAAVQEGEEAFRLAEPAGNPLLSARCRMQRGLALALDLDVPAAPVEPVLHRLRAGRYRAERLVDLMGDRRHQLVEQ